MIPTRLELHNFLPYRAPDPLYFEGIHLACLTGHNGAGKSSLLDAITWALWGKARGKRDDDLVHLGASEMYVQLDFEQEGSNYRVLRRRKSGRRGHGELELFGFQSDGSLRTLKEPNMRGTQAKINDILRLDYETFVNSAFLQQGKADAFTTKTPGERKKILTDILGLDQWRVYEDRVKEQIKTLDTHAKVYAARIEDIDTELAREGQYQRDLKAAEDSEKLAQDALEEAEKRLEEVADAPADLRNAQETQANIQRRLRDYQSDLKAVQGNIVERQKKIAEYETVVTQADQIEQGYETLQTARETDSALNHKMRQMSDLDQRYNDIQTQITSERNRIEREKADFQATIREAQRLLQEDHTQHLADVQTKIAALEDREAKRDTLQRSLGDMKEERSGLNSTKKTLTTEGQEMNERIATLEQTDSATCPLCGQALSDEHRTQVLTELIDERDAKRQTYRDTTQRIKDLDQSVKATQKNIDSIGDELAALPKLRSQAGALEKQQANAVEAQVRFDEATAGLQSRQVILDQDDFAHEWRDQLQAVEAEREALGYDRAAHDDIQQQLTQFRQYEKQHTQLEIARNALPTEKEMLDNAEARKARIDTAIAEETDAQKTLEKDIERLTALVAEYRKRQQEVATQRTAATQAREKVVIAEQQLASLEQQRRRKADLQDRLDNTEAEKATCEALRLAFGKNGVPAMVIETAIPELEVAANELLTRMTDGRMHLRLTTQREKQSGGVMETLDIEIADELGTRAYEMYSGGEAFRINFALRVALSKMLARRAGAHLRTLFIDEGFGTQDDDGRNKLVEAITAIQNDFDLVLVITHIDELRDAFPVHVVVNKTPNGSMVRVR